MREKKKIDYTKYQIRTCQSLHSCAICKAAISLGQQYHDGGYGRRAHVECVKQMVAEDQCREANNFAMDLLMPEEMVRKEFAKTSGIFCDQDLSRMAKKFEVERIRMLQRLYQLQLLEVGER